MPSDIEATEAKRTSEKDAVTMEESLDLIGMICTVTKFHKFSITQILREINFWDSILTHLGALEFFILRIFALFEVCYSPNELNSWQKLQFYNF